MIKIKKNRSLHVLHFLLLKKINTKLIGQGLVKRFEIIKINVNRSLHVLGWGRYDHHLYMKKYINKSVVKKLDKLHINIYQHRECSGSNIRTSFDVMMPIVLLVTSNCIYFTIKSNFKFNIQHFPYQNNLYSSTNICHTVVR